MTKTADQWKESEKIRYEKMWAIDDYRKSSPGMRCLSLFLTECKPQLSEVIGDFGVGSGKVPLVLNEAGYRVVMVDLAENCLDQETKEAIEPGKLDFVQACLWELPDDLEPVDWFYCTDVMEHIPEEMVDAVLENLKAKSKKGGFFNIATYLDGFGDRIDDVLHLTVYPAQWWEEKLSKHWRIISLETTELDVKIVTYPLEQNDGLHSSTET